MDAPRTEPGTPARGTIRKLFDTDLPLFREHLLRLDPVSRRDRFIGAVGDGYLATYAERCFASDGLVYGYVEDGRVRGVAELQPYGAMAERHAEAAFSVEDDWRCQGVGSALFARLVVAACNRNVRLLAMNCLAHNRPMLALARKFGAELTLAHGETLGTLRGRGPTPFTLLEEALDDARGFTDAALDLQRRIWAPRRRGTAAGDLAA